MTTRSKIRLAVASLALVAAALYCLWLWQPERQVLKHQANLLRAAEARKWSRFSDFIDPQYSDRWGHDKAFIVRECSEWLRQFFTLSIQSETLAHEVSAERGTITARIRLDGRGTALADMAKDEVNGITEPFVFQWTRKSWKPWDWQLTGADNADPRFSAQMSRGEGF